MVASTHSSRGIIAERKKRAGQKEHRHDEEIHRQLNALPVGDEGGDGDSKCRE
jgi:hypothetical protein